MKKDIVVIAAVSQNGVYTHDGTIPWKIREDLEHFKELTMGNTVIMGRLTWESLPKSVRPLPGRENFVVSRDTTYVVSGASTFASLSNAIKASTARKIFCIGGDAIWHPAMSFANEAWITLVQKEYPIVIGNTKTANYLVRPYEKWPDLYLSPVRKFDSLQNMSIPFKIEHWVR